MSKADTVQPDPAAASTARQQAYGRRSHGHVRTGGRSAAWLVTAFATGSGMRPASNTGCSAD